MTVQIATFLLAICAAATTLITEAIKKTFEGGKPTITAAIVSAAVGIFIPVAYLVINHLPVTTQDVIYIIGLVVLTWLCSTLSYDKVMEIIHQFVGNKDGRA